MTNYNEIRKLLGGYATGTLTAEENRRLMAAAMEDQRIFDALADEEALRELLSDASFRQELARELRETPGFRQRLMAWWQRPLPLALAGGAAAVAVALLIVVPLWQTDKPVEIAMERSAARQDVMEQDAADSPRVLRSLEDAGAPASESSSPPAPQAAAPRVDYPLTEPASPPSGGGGSISPRSSPEERGRNELKQGLAGAVTSDAPTRQTPSADWRTERMARAKAVPEGAEPPSAMMELQNEEADAAVLAGAAATAAPSALQVRVERLEGGGRFEALAGGAAVGRDDKVRLRIEAPAPGYVSVLISDSGSAWEELAETQISGLRPVYVPAEGALDPPETPGVRYFRLRYSTQPPPDSGRVGSTEAQVIIVYQ